MKNRKRALRRRHVKRLKNKRKEYWHGYAGRSQSTLGKCITTPCVCSCWMCGHQRKHYGPTAQELRSGSLYVEDDEQRYR